MSNPAPRGATRRSTGGVCAHGVPSELRRGCDLGCSGRAGGEPGVSRRETGPDLGRCPRVTRSSTPSEPRPSLRPWPLCSPRTPICRAWPGRSAPSPAPSRASASRGARLKARMLPDPQKGRGSEPRRNPGNRGSRPRSPRPGPRGRSPRQLPRPGSPWQPSRRGPLAPPGSLQAAPPRSLTPSSRWTCCGSGCTRRSRRPGARAAPRSCPPRLWRNGGGGGWSGTGGSGSGGS